MKYEATIKYLDEHGSWVGLVMGGDTEPACVECVGFNLTMNRDFESNPMVSVRWAAGIDRLPMIGHAKEIVGRLYK